MDSIHLLETQLVLKSVLLGHNKMLWMPDVFLKKEKSSLAFFSSLFFFFYHKYIVENKSYLLGMIFVLVHWRHGENYQPLIHCF